MNRVNSEAVSEKSARPWLLAGGWLLFAMGLAGIFLPVMPTTVFWIGAVWCWSRSAPHLTRRILSHPRFGQAVQLFIEHGMMTRNGKRMAVFGICSGYLLLHLLGNPLWFVSLLLGMILAATIVWLWRRPEPAAIPLYTGSGLPISDLTGTSPHNLRNPEIRREKREKCEMRPECEARHHLKSSTR